MSQPSCYYCQASLRLHAPVCPSCQQSLLLRGRYWLAQTLGQGGFGVVYLADDQLLHRPCAIKAVPITSLQEQQRVEAEARLLGRYATQFTFIPDVYDLWSETNRTFIAMEYVDGEGLDQFIGKPWPPFEVYDFLKTMLTYLSELHDAGVIHRDLKPHNIKRTTQGRYILLDFGIAKQGAATATVGRAFSPDYAPLEQLQGQPTTERSDLYSLGATAYQLLVGAPPPSVLDRLMNPDLPALHSGNLGARGLERTIQALLEVQPDQRPTDARNALLLLGTPHLHIPPTPKPAPAVKAAPPTSAGQLTTRLTPPPSATAQYDIAFHRFISIKQLSVRSKLAKWVSGYANTIKATAIASDGTRLLIGMKDGRIWKIVLDHYYYNRFIWNDLVNEIWSLTSSMDGALVASSDGSFETRVWEADTGALKGVLQGHTDIVSSMAFSSDQRWLVSGSYDHSIRIWNLTSFRQHRSIVGHTAQVKSVSITPDNQRIISVAADNTLQLWNLADGTPQASITLPSNPWSAAVAPDNNHIAVGLRNGNVLLYDHSTLTIIATLESESHGVGALTFSPDGALLCAGYDNGAVTIWRTSNQQAYYLAPEHNNMVTSLHFLPHQQTMISCDAQSKIVLWKPEI